MIGAGVVALWVASAGCSREQPPTKDAAINHFLAASQAVERGDQTAALAELDASLAERPTSWAYYQRAQLLLKDNKDAKAASDCAEGLKLEPNYRDVQWLAGEIKKPASQRFKGKFAKSPSSKK